MRPLSLPILLMSAAVCLTASAPSSAEEPFGIGGAGIGGAEGGSMAIGGAGGLGTGGNLPTGGGPGTGGSGAQQSGNGGAGGGGVTSPVSAGAGAFGTTPTRDTEKCNCRMVESVPAESAALWLLVLGAALTRYRRRSR